MNEDIIKELKCFNEEYEKDLTRTCNYLKNIRNRELRKYIENSNSGNILQIIRFLLEENEELKKYCCKRNDCVGRLKENHKLTDSEILIEFEKWLMSEKIMFYRGSDGEILISYGEVRYKLQELKGEIK